MAETITNIHDVFDADGNRTGSITVLNGGAGFRVFDLEDRQLELGAGATFNQALDVLDGFRWVSRWTAR